MAAPNWDSLLRIVEHLPDPTMVIDVEGRIVAWNPEMERLTGVPKEAMLGRGGYAHSTPFYGFARPMLIDLVRRHDPEVESAYELFEKRGRSLFAEISAPALRGGRGAYIWGTASPLHDQEGRFIGAIEQIRDVTKRKEMENALIASEDRLAMALDASNDGLWDYDARRGRLYFSPRCAGMLGYAPEELSPFDRPWASLLHPDDLPDADAAFERLFAGETDALEMEYRLRTKGGEYRWILSRGKAFNRGPDGRPTRVAGTHTDITALKRAEAEALEWERRYETAIAAARMLAYDVNVWSGEILWGANMERLLGFAPDERGGVRWWIDHMHPDDRADVVAMFERAIASQGVLEASYRVRRRDGQWIWLADRGYVIGLGREARMFGVLSEDTARREAEETLRRSEAHFRALIERSFDGIVLVDEGGVVRYVSPSTTTILGWEPQELLGRKEIDFLHPDDQARVAPFLAALRGRPGGSYTAVARGRRRDGEWRWLEGTVTNLLQEPAVRAIVTNYRDVTERRRLEEQFREAQKMESVGRLAGGVAHDFNNLLTVIVNAAELAASDLPAESEARRDLAAVQEAAARAATLTQRLLAFARRQIVQPSAVDLNALLADMGQLLRRLLGEDVELDAPPEGATPAIARVDRGLIEQVVVNLAVNARDAMPDGGRLTLRAAPADAGDADRFVALTVSDTGCGMSEEVRRHLFEPFFTTKAAGKGTGLGLATCYGIVQQSGGRIEVESAVGEGTTVRVFLPCAAAADVAPVRPAPRRAPRGSESILVVEDEAALRDLAVRVLGAAGYRVRAAADADEALALAGREGAPALLLTDVVMPRMDGRELARRFREAAPGAKVLFMSGYTDDALLRSGEFPPGVALLPKPFAPAALLEAVRRALDGVR